MRRGTTASVILAVLAVLLAVGCGDGEPEVRIVFTSERDGDSDIYVMEPDGTDVQQLTNGPARDYEADSSPDGRTLVFASQPAGEDTSQLYLMNLDGSEVRALTLPGEEARRDDYPHWSPDGRQIVFQRTTLGEKPDADVWLVDVDSGEETQLTDAPDIWDSTPSFEAAGTSVLFESSRSGNFDIYRMSLPDKGLVRLTDHEGRETSAKQSPDGALVAFVSNRDGDREIYVMNSDGSDVRALTANDAGDHCPQWSPDSQRISFYSDRDGDPEIYVMNSDGTDQQRLTDSPGLDEVPDWVSVP